MKTKMRDEKLNRQIEAFKEKSIHGTNICYACEEGVCREKYILPPLKKVTIGDYMEWLRGYLDQGGKFTHYFDFDFRDEDGFYVALDDFSMDSFQRQVAKVIVPLGVRLLGGGYAHCTLYLMEGYRVEGTHCIPIYRDIQF